MVVSGASFSHLHAKSALETALASTWQERLVEAIMVLRDSAWLLLGLQSPSAAGCASPRERRVTMAVSTGCKEKHLFKSICCLISLLTKL